ncbi:L,D-transpeptidase family protein [Salsipaludibacter albus]|uniref:L,D-transpeptidase family protein n=1 Tax=Salsipaludibacter albus TaxID=2849650 RepID=UPI001EE3CE3B|nr:peptidoglycan-binding protein [Salsipaludibacter albus]MBY5162758.1 peptidoglycan-binding protein [Salsipaludibacter albus]
MPISPRAAAALAVAGLLLSGCGAASGASSQAGSAVQAEPVAAQPVALGGSSVDAVGAQVLAVGAERLAEAEAAMTARQDAKVVARDRAVVMAAAEAQRDAKRSARQAARDLVEEQERLDEIAANKDAQEILKELGYYDGGIDGDVGPKTKAAVEEFQEVNGLEVDGVIGDQTTKALESDDAKPKPEPEPEPEEDEESESEGEDDEPVDDGEGVMSVSDAQKVLRDQGYYLGEVDGEAGDAFTSALVAFQKVNGISRDGSLGPDTSAALRNPKQPSLKGGNSTRIEIDLSAQVIHLVKNGTRVRTMPTSSGNGEQYATSSGGTANAKTPVGDFVIERRIEGIREADLGILYDPLYFYKGWAIHGSNSVPAYEASHGCTRLTRADAKWLGAQVPNGTQVRIYGGTHTFIPTG